MTRPRRLLALAALALVTGLVACEDPFAPKAETSNFDAAIEVWAMTGAPTNFPTVLLVPQRFVVRPDAAASFDVGFDIDPDGRLIVIPVRNVVSSLTGDRRIGIIRTADPYATIIEAPRTGWMFDTTITVVPGQTFILRVQTQFCQSQFSDEVYGKFHVDSVITAERRIKLSARINPNCGFRSLLSGIPTF